MKRAALLTAIATLLVAPAFAADHLVRPSEVQTALAAAAAAREKDLGALRTVLGTPEAARAAQKLGVDLHRVQQLVPTLSDGELRDLAQRASALRSDPVAGVEDKTLILIAVILIIPSVILLLAI